MPEVIFQLVYISRAIPTISYSDLQRILESSQRNNERLGLTGILVYKEGHFMQLLEGPEAHVLEILGRIVQDRRNSHLQVVHESPASKRLFAEWSMAFRDGDLDRSPDRELIEKMFTAARDAFQPRSELMSPLEELGRRMNSPS